MPRRSTQEAVDATELSLICVGTPSRRNGSLDLSYLERVCEQIGEALEDKDGYHVVVVRSTVLPGTTHGVVIPALERTSGKTYGTGFGVAVNPEFLREGTAIKDFRQPPMTLVGHNRKSDASRPRRSTRRSRPRSITTSIRTAEMIKYASNTWHALKVCFANEVGNLCKRLDIDSHEVMDIFCRDEKLNLSSYYMKPGFAFGGSCLPKDVRAMQYSRRRKSTWRCRSSRRSSAATSCRSSHAIDMVVETGRKRVGLLGFSFKAGTDDLRESPIVILAEALLGKGYSLSHLRPQRVDRAAGGCEQGVHQQQIPHLSSLLSDSLDEVLEQSDVIVVGNGSPEFAEALEEDPPGSDRHRSVQAEGRSEGHPGPVHRDLLVGRRAAVREFAGSRQNRQRSGASFAWASRAPRSRSRTPAATANCRRVHRNRRISVQIRSTLAVELMIVVEHVQLDVGPRLRPLLHRHRIDRVVSPPLEHLDRHGQRRAGAVVARRVGVELVVDRHHPAVAVVEDVEPVGALPFLEPSIAEARLIRLPPKSSAGASRIRLRTRAGRVRATCTATNPPRLEPDQHHRSRTRVDDAQDLLDHPGDGERGEIRFD